MPRRMGTPVRCSLEQGLPCGGNIGQTWTVAVLGLQATLNPRGRPRVSSES
ncbi:MAG: hypothetical protein ACR2FY_02955 [Pirellulaceae bacterium]